MNHVTHPISPADISNFSPEISQVCYIKKYMYRLHFDSKFLIVLVKKITILMMPAKMGTSGLLKIKVFGNKGYDVIIYVYDVTNRILSNDSHFIVDVIM